MKRIKTTLRDNWSILLTAIFIIITSIYCIIAGDNIYLQVHDNLDGCVSLYKLLCDGNLFWSVGTEVPILGGISRDYFYSDLKIYSWLYMVLPNLVAIIVGWYLKIILSVLGFYLLGKTINKTNEYKNIFVFTGLIYGVLPTFPTTPLGFASLPLLLWIFIKLYFKLDWKYFVALLIYPLLSDFSFFGIFICGYILIFFVIDWFVRKKPAWRFVAAAAVLVIGYVITEWRLFYTMLFLNEESIKTTFVYEYYDWKHAFIEFVEVFVNGQYHSGSVHKFVVLPACFLYSVYLVFKYIKNRRIFSIFSDPFIWLMIWQAFNCVIYVFDKMEWFCNMVSLVLPLMKGFSFARTLWFSPFIWYLAFTILLCRVNICNSIKIIVCTASFIVVCISPSTYNHIWNNLINAFDNIIGEEHFEQLYDKGVDHLSYGEFYSERLFDNIKKEIDYNGEWSVAYGMHPSILNYNGISSLDGYLSYYPKSYKTQFRKLIEPDLKVDEQNAVYYDNWGGRAYLFSKDISYQPYRNSDIKTAELLIDPSVFKEMGGKYIFSRVKIINNTELDLRELGSFDDEKSPYTIWVYETI